MRATHHTKMMALLQFFIVQTDLDFIGNTITMNLRIKKIKYFVTRTVNKYNGCKTGML